MKRRLAVLLLAAAVANGSWAATGRAASVEGAGRSPTADARPTVVRLATIENGRATDSRGQLLLRDATAVAAARLADGSLVVVFERPSARDGQASSRFFLCRSEDGGRRWSAPRAVTIDGFPASAEACSPALTVLPDGTVYLFFAMCDRAETADRAAEGRWTIRAAVSRGPDSFRFAPSVEIPADFDRPPQFAAVFVDRTLRVFVGEPSRPSTADRRSRPMSKLRQFESGDGRHFRGAAPVRVPALTSLGNGTAERGAVRLFGADDRGVRSVRINARGRAEPEAHLWVGNAANPNVVPVERDKYLLLYVTEAPPTRTSERAIVATSPAGAIGGPRETGDGAGAASDAADAEALAAGTQDVWVPQDLGPIEDLLPPPPDFTNNVDYVSWYEEQLLGGMTENAFDAYATFMTLPTDKPGTKPEWPTFNDMFNGDNSGFVGPWLPAEHPDWEATYQATQDLLAQFRDVMEYTYYATPPMFPDDATPEQRRMIAVLLPSLAQHRTLTKATLANAWRIGDTGRVTPEQMTDAWRTTLRGAAHLHQGGTLIEHLVGIAEQGLTRDVARDALSYGVFSTADELENALRTLRANDAPLPDPAQYIRCEHAAALDTVQYLFSPPDAAGNPTVNTDRLREFMAMIDGKKAEDIPDDALPKLTGDDAYAAIEAFDGFYPQLTELMRTGYPTVRIADLRALEETYVQNNELTRVFLPSLARVHTLRARAEANRRATQVAYAVHALHARNGRWPQSLDELPEEYRDDIRTDPFSGADFQYRVGDDGPVIYSVSENGLDDGGVHAPRWGDKSAEGESDDFVFWPPQP
jgi:hypothetical protein